MSEEKIDFSNIFPDDPPPSLDEQIEQLPKPLGEYLKIAQQMFLKHPPPFNFGMPSRKLEQRTFHLKVDRPETYHPKLDGLFAEGWHLLQTIPSITTTDVLLILSREEEIEEGEGKHDTERTD